MDRIILNKPSAAKEESGDGVQVVHSCDDVSSEVDQVSSAGFQGDRVPLCRVQPHQSHCQQHAEAQHHFLQEFEPRSCVLERADPVTTRPIRSIALILGQRGQEEENPANTTPWLLLSIVSIFCCGWLFGLLPLLFVCQARDLRLKGCYSTSHKALFKARVLLLVAFLLGTVVWIAIAYKLYEHFHESQQSIWEQFGGNFTQASNSDYV